MVIDMDCLFCKIINKEIPAKIIYEDEYTIAFLDIHPKAAGHTLIIPKVHTKDFSSISPEQLNRINQTAKIVYQLINKELHPDGIKIAQNNGIYQDVLHYHVHIVPGYKNDKSLSLDEVHEILKNGLN